MKSPPFSQWDCCYRKPTFENSLQCSYGFSLRHPEWQTQPVSAQSAHTQWTTLKRGFRQHYFTRNKCESSTELMSLQQMEHSCLSRAATCSGDITVDSSGGIHSVDRLLMIMIHVAAIKEQFLSTSGNKRVTWRRASVCANDVTRITALLVINTSKSSACLWCCCCCLDF